MPDFTTTPEKGFPDEKSFYARSKKGKVEEEMFGVSLGKFDAEVCDCCGEAFFSLKETERMEAKAKELGVWGLAKHMKIVKSGNSLSVRIPAKIARFL
ncbi:MAG: hypothetical protein L6407_05600, partial [Candidatus Delongbacteria bacterium]|nr:hypothetical protein [Candidatus Delongbacteria bacterium]